MQFGLYLVNHGLITANQFVKALEAQLASRPQIGALAIETKKISVKEVFSILRTQADLPQERFGELAVKAGLLSELDLANLLYYQSVRAKLMTQIISEMGFASTEDIEEYFAEYRAECQSASRKEPVVAY